MSTRFPINSYNSKLFENIIITNALDKHDLQIQTALASKTRASVLFENCKIEKSLVKFK